jgi:hypothetical protein
MSPAYIGYLAIGGVCFPLIVLIIFRVASSFALLLDLMCFAYVSLLSICMPRQFTSFFWGAETLPICTFRQVWLHMVNVRCVNLLWFILILHFFAQSLILLMVAWSFIEAIAGASCEAKIGASSAKIVVVALSDVGR